MRLVECGVVGAVSGLESLLLSDAGKARILEFMCWLRVRLLESERKRIFGLCRG